MRPSLLKRIIQRGRVTPSLDRGSATNTIQAPHIGPRLMRALGIREMAPTPELAREIVPVIIVDDVSADAGRDLKQEYWVGRHITTPTAGDFATIGLRNTTTDDEVTVDGIYANQTAGTSVSLLHASILAGAAAVATSIVEPRSRGEGGGSRSTFAEFWENTVLAVIPGCPLAVRVGGTGGFLPLNWTIAPGNWLWIINNTVTSNLDVSILWHEQRRRE